MLNPRIIPCLLLNDGELVKTRKFQPFKYIGDPLNTLRILNEKRVDEVVIWDIGVSCRAQVPNYDLIAKLAYECRMPLCYGGGVASVEMAEKIIDLGVEKVSVCSAATPELFENISNKIGNQSLVAVINIAYVNSSNADHNIVCVNNNGRPFNVDPLSRARELELAGAGEIILNFVERDGTMCGYDLVVAKQFIKILNVPLTIVGGAGSNQDIVNLFSECGLVGAGAGALFVLKGGNDAVLINYPTLEMKKKIFLLRSTPKPINFNLE